MLNTWLEQIGSVHGIQIKYKDESIFMKFLGLILFFNKNFASWYTTTIGNTIYFPTRKWVQEWEDRAVRVCWHELVHVLDRKMLNDRFPFFYELIYLFPQCLAVLSVFSLLSFFSLWFLFALVFLIFLAPIPSCGRAWLETRAYAMNMYISYLKMGEGYNAEQHVQVFEPEFMSVNYYYMSGDWKQTKENLINCLRKLPQTHVAFKKARDWYSK
ncbi:MAG: hypothetical protein WC444_04735 [Candidatus Paceibacterota bacterium]